MTAEVFEALMLICFGASWPVAIAKTLRVRKVHGKSVVFLFMVHLGYLCGISAKFLRAGGGLPNWVTLLYGLNAVMVAVEIVLYFRFREPQSAAGLNLEVDAPAAEVTRDG